MKKIISFFTALFIVVTIFSFTKINNNVVYTVKAKDSKIEFIGNKKNGYHPGYFPIKSGNVTVNDGKITGGKFIIDIANIKVTDESGVNLESTLKSQNFFDALNFGLAEYEITSVKYKDETNADIVGMLTIKGIKVEVAFTALVRDVNDKTLFAQGFFSVDRTKVGLSGFEKDISKDVQIAVHLFANK